MALPTRVKLWPKSFGTNAGNAAPLRISRTNLTQEVLSFAENVDGEAFGRCRVPDNVAGTANAYVELWIQANATSGVTRLNVSTRIVGDGDATDAAFTAETAQDITVPGTARLLEVVRFPAAGSLGTSFASAAGKMFQVKIEHLGAHANDTLAVATELLEAFLVTDRA